jgi:hypothetical protein
MQPGSGRLRLSDETPAGGGGGGTDLTVPAGPLLHFVYHVPARRQYLAPLPQPPDSAQVCSSQKAEFLAYQTWFKRWTWCRLDVQTRFSRFAKDLLKILSHV